MYINEWARRCSVDPQQEIRALNLRALVESGDQMLESLINKLGVGNKGSLFVSECAIRVALE